MTPRTFINLSYFSQVCRFENIVLSLLSYLSLSEILSLGTVSSQLNQSIFQDKLITWILQRELQIIQERTIDISLFIRKLKFFYHHFFLHHSLIIHHPIIKSIFSVTLPSNWSILYHLNLLNSEAKIIFLAFYQSSTIPPEDWKLFLIHYRSETREEIDLNPAMVFHHSQLREIDNNALSNKMIQYSDNNHCDHNDSQEDSESLATSLAVEVSYLENNIYLIFIIIIFLIFLSQVASLDDEGSYLNYGTNCSEDIYPLEDDNNTCIYTIDTNASVTSFYPSDDNTVFDSPHTFLNKSNRKKRLRGYSQSNLSNKTNNQHQTSSSSMQTHFTDVNNEHSSHRRRRLSESSYDTNYSSFHVLHATNSDNSISSHNFPSSTSLQSHYSPSIIRMNHQQSYSPEICFPYAVYNQFPLSFNSSEIPSNNILPVEIDELNNMNNESHTKS